MIVTTVHSFDVFDTCLTRRVPEPSTVFYDVARRVFARLGLAWSASLAEDFVAARLSAERIAREKSNREDTTLREIWQRLCGFMGWEDDPSLAECELAAEEDTLIPISIVRARVKAARLRGKRIIFVSDMYLPREFIWRQLVRHGVAETGDQLYVSSEAGLLKSTGNLFRQVMAQEKVAPAEMLHLGDNPHSDFKVPRRLGIRVELFTGHRLTTTEKAVAEVGRNPRGGVSLAGAMREFRLADAPEKDDGLIEVVSQFVAPFILGFATWVLRRAQEKGVKRLYFMSRDCQLTWKVASELAPRFGIDCRYLYVSRQALFLPAIDELSPAEMPWMRRSFEEPVLDRLLAKIELTYESIEPILGARAGTRRGGFQLRSAQDWDAFWQALKHESVKGRLLKSIQVRREAALQYFKAVGLFDPEPWAVVDLGWSLSCQQSLRKILRSAGRTDRVSGLYLELAQTRAAPSVAGEAESLFYQVPPDAVQGREFMQSSATLMEHLLGCADHPTVHHYENAGPAYLKAIKPCVASFCDRLHCAVLRCARGSLALTEEFSDAASCRRMLDTLFRSFVWSPSKPTAQLLSTLQAGKDQNNLDEQPIVRSLTLGEALLPVLPGGSGPLLSKWKARERIWPQGSRAITPSSILWISDVAMELRAKLKRLR